MKEIKIIKACKKERPEGQKALYELYMPYVLSVCRRFRVEEKELKDVIQEIFIETFLSIKKYDAGKGPFKGWIKSIAIHKILNYQRSKKKGKIVELTVEIRDTHLDNKVIEQIDKEHLLNLISELPDGYRTIFNLYVIDGFSHKEIAKMLGISEAGSRSQLSRAKKILKEKICKQKHSGRYESI